MIGIGMKRFAMRNCTALSLALAIDGAALAQTPSPNEKKTISITWLGHAAFEIVSSGAVAGGQYARMAWLAVNRVCGVIEHRRYSTRPDMF
jgi:hypothetical protein